MKTNGFLWLAAMGGVGVFIACGGGGGGHTNTVATSSATAPASTPVTTTTASADIAKPPGSVTTNQGPVSDEAARGIKALQLGDLTTAKAALEAAVKKNPKDAEAHFYL